MIWHIFVSLYVCGIAVRVVCDMEDDDLPFKTLSTSWDQRANLSGLFSLAEQPVCLLWCYLFM